MGGLGFRVSGGLGSLGSKALETRVVSGLGLGVEGLDTRCPLRTR